MINEDIFRCIMEKAKVIPQIIYIARQAGSCVVCGHFDTYEKARDCIRNQSYLLDHRYEIIEVDLCQLGHTLEEDDGVKISKERSHPDHPGYWFEQKEKLLWVLPLEEAKEHVESLRLFYSPGCDLSFFDNIISKRSEK